MDGGSDQWPAIDGTSNHGWDRPKPLTGPPISGSQNVVFSSMVESGISFLNQTVIFRLNSMAFLSHPTHLSFTIRFAK